MGSFFSSKISRVYACIAKLFKCIVLCVILASFILGAGAACVTTSSNASALGIKDFFQNIFNPKDETEQQSNVNVYLGGMPLGFTLQCNGVIVIAVGQVHTAAGVVDTIVDGNIMVGDVVTKIDGNDITSAGTINDYLSKQQNETKRVELSIIRGNQNVSAKIQPAKDVITGEYKLGLWIRDNSAGVGTLTYIREDNLRLGALGHSVCDVDTGVMLPVGQGNVYKCNIIGVAPSKKGTAGELKGLFLKSGTVMGSLDKNTNYGVFGTASEALVSSAGKKVKVASRGQVRTGKASIYCCIDGNEPKEYSIEIIKATRQSKLSSKSMIIRVTDPELIAKTGGIVQGMSGSPIVQNGMLVGAVTHVFVSDPTKGYGIYADWMIGQ